MLEIKQPNCEIIFENLRDEKGFDVWLPSDKEEDKEDVPGEPNDLFEGETEGITEQPNENDIVFTLDRKKDIEKRLKTIFRRASSDYQEKGLRTSVIALGLLNWKEREKGEKILIQILYIVLC